MSTPRTSWLKAAMTAVVYLVVGAIFAAEYPLVGAFFGALAVARLFLLWREVQRNAAIAERRAAVRSESLDTPPPVE